VVELQEGQSPGGVNLQQEAQTEGVELELQLRGPKIISSSSSSSPSLYSSSTSRGRPGGAAGGGEGVEGWWAGRREVGTEVGANSGWA
jgi:hypothetical protein